MVQPELLDALPPESPGALRSRRDLRRINRWMRNDVIMASALKKTLNGRVPDHITELGAGDGTFLLRIARRTSCGWQGVAARLLDLQESVAPETLAAFEDEGWRAETAAADVFDAWKAGGECDVVIANLFLHHFEDSRLAELLFLISQRAKLLIAVEPRRALWPLLCSRLLRAAGCNDVTRHDAVVSVRAGFSGNELSTLWPDIRNWRVTEQRAGGFSHLLIARKVC